MIQSVPEQPDHRGRRSREEDLVDKMESAPLSWKGVVVKKAPLLVLLGLAAAAVCVGVGNDNNSNKPFLEGGQEEGQEAASWKKNDRRPVVSFRASSKSEASKNEPRVIKAPGLSWNDVYRTNSSSSSSSTRVLSHDYVRSRSRSSSRSSRGLQQFDASAGELTWSCPSSSSDSEDAVVSWEVPKDLVVSGLKLTLPPVSGDNTLCQLHIHAALETRYMARSYNGFDWEAYSNRDTLDATNQHHHHHVNSVDCSSGDCTLDIVFATPPTWDAATDDHFVLYLETKTRPAVSLQTEAARFLEQTTFGTTRTEIQDILELHMTTGGTSLLPALAKYVQDQIQQVPMTPHREYFRQRTNGRLKGSHRVGHATHPCQVGTWYRRAVFTEHDRLESLTIQTHPSLTGKLILSVAGEVRTVVDGPITTTSHGNSDYPDGTYKFCYESNGDVVGSRLRLRDPYQKSACRSVTVGGVYGNPTVALEDQTPAYLIPLDGHVTEKPATNDDGQSDLLYVNTAIDDATCEQIVKTAGDMPLVFGRYNGQDYIHDPRFELQENTLKNPLQDGGASWVQLTAHSTVEAEKIICSNVRRSIFNQEDCFLSTDPQTCSTSDDTAGAGIVVCGSEGEVANDLSLPLDPNEGTFSMKTTTNDVIRSSVSLEQQKIAWMAISLWSKDQLRQRVAWALCQFFAINTAFSRKLMTEDHLWYYDIFVRHAFGNFRDIVRQVSYSPEMANFLSYLGSSSTAFLWERNKNTHIIFPDENYAREIMQLFVVGLYKMNQDGSVQRDENGAIRSYETDDILEYARVWTGFDIPFRQPRGNIEEAYFAPQGPRIDPLIIERNKRDRHPKMGLNGQYVGDGYPLCADLPVRHFLKKGAVYRVLGNNPTPEMQYEPESWADDGKIGFKADTTGGANSLYGKLCASADSTGPCTYPGWVPLTEDLECHGDECNVDTITTVEVGDGIFYEYIRPPCVNLGYIASPAMAQRHQYGGRWYMCADPRLEIASTTCCAPGNRRAYINELFWGEKVRFSTAQARCSARTDSSNALCTVANFNMQDCDRYTQCSHRAYYWTDFDCLQQAKIDPDGKVAIVHHAPGANADRVMMHLREDHPTFFRVHWSGEVQTLLSSCASNAGCSIASDGNCLCDVSVTETVAFDRMPSVEEVLSLTIGAFEPDYIGGYYSHTENGVTVYATQPGLYNDETIFELVDDNGRTQRRKNIVSTVSVSGSSLSFRNPVHFLSFGEGNGDVRDATYETEAALDHYFYHDNAPPFLAVRLAQRFGVSNPSPRYVSVVAQAFKTGNYEFVDGGTSISFGDGVYGNLAATVAALILDREVRTPVLDKDQLHGSVREPWLKVIGLMRSMEFEPLERPFPKFQASWLGVLQQPHEIPDVFSFFDHVHQPDGAVAELGLVSPESNLHVTPSIVSLMNGLVSLIKYGFDHCYGGFGEGDLSSYRCRDKQAGSTVGATGVLKFAPSDPSAAAAVDELATIMTSGRLSDEHKSLIVNEFEQEQDTTQAVIKAQQMIVTTPEYHTTGMAETSPSPPESPPTTNTLKPYKAVIQVHLGGGLDSSNVIIPHDGCSLDSSGTAYNEQYLDRRGVLAIGTRSADRRYLIDVDGQPCARFAINRNIPILQQLYNDGDLVFFFNTGVLNKPSTKENFNAVTLTRLFAHNTMRAEIDRLDPFGTYVGSGVMGRLASVLSEPEYGYTSQMLAIDNAAGVLSGGPTTPVILSEHGPTRLLEQSESETFDLKNSIPDLNSIDNGKSSVFARAWSDRMLRAMAEAEEISDTLDGTTVESSDSTKALKFTMVTKWLQTHQARGVDRDFAYVFLGGFDHHFDLHNRMTEKLTELNTKLTFLVNELKAHGLWDSVTIVFTSDFGRTITPNSGDGSDHAWGSHTFILGGGVKGKQAFGEFPDLSANSPLDVGRGRLLPTLSWDSIWNPIVGWLGINPADRDRILPNAASTGTTLFEEEEVFVV